MPRIVARSVWLRALRDHGPRQPGVLLTLFVISTYMNKSGVAYPSQKTIANGIRGTLRTVQRNIDVAVRDGWLSIHVAGRTGKGWRHHAYTPAIPEGADTSVASTSDNVATPMSPASASHRGDNGAATWRQSIAQVATNSVDRGDTHVARSSASEVLLSEAVPSEGSADAKNGARKIRIGRGPIPDEALDVIVRALKQSGLNEPAQIVHKLGGPERCTLERAARALERVA